MQFFLLVIERRTIMANPSWRIVATVGLLMGGCSADGSSSSRPPVTALSEGLNLLDVHDPSWGLNAAYVKAGRVIYLESRVGALKPEVYRHEFPNDPPNEQD